MKDHPKCLFPQLLEITKCCLFCLCRVLFHHFHCRCLDSGSHLNWSITIALQFVCLLPVHMPHPLPEGSLLKQIVSVSCLKTLPSRWSPWPFFLSFFFFGFSLKLFQKNFLFLNITQIWQVRTRWFLLSFFKPLSCFLCFECSFHPSPTRVTTVSFKPQLRCHVASSQETLPTTVIPLPIWVLHSMPNLYEFLHCTTMWLHVLVFFPSETIKLLRICVLFPELCPVTDT